MERIFGADGRWLIKTPDNYKGKTYCNGRYICEHRYIMEQKIGRLLKEDEHVHHINNNKLDNRIENLTILNRKNHTSLHNKLRGQTWVVFKCPTCNKISEKRKYQIYGKKNIFCSKECVGRYNHKKNKGISRKDNILYEYKKYPHDIKPES